MLLIKNGGAICLLNIKTVTSDQIRYEKKRKNNKT